MSYTAVEGEETRTQEPEYTPLKAVFFVSNVAFCRAFGGLLAAMLAAGHRVVMALDHAPDGTPAADLAFLEGMHQQHPTFSYRILHARLDLWRIPANAVRRSLDYIHYLGGGYEETDPRRQRARARAPRALRALLYVPPFCWPFGRNFLAWLLRHLEAGMPVPRSARALIAEEAPDVALVSPLVDLGSNQADYLRAAQLAWVPSVFMVWGDDDLNAKGAIRDLPTLTIASSQRQADEAVTLQGLPADRVVVAEAEGTNGATGPAAALAVVERTAAEKPAPRGQGRILRPVLRLLTPLLVVVLPIVRPRSSARAAGRVLRQMPGRVRKRWADRARRRDRARKARVDADKKATAEAREQKRSRAEAGRVEKAQRAEAKEQERAQSMTTRHEKLTRAKQKRDESRLARRSTKARDTAADGRSSPPAESTQPRGPVGDRERDPGTAGQGAPARGEGARAGGQGTEGTGAEGAG